MARNLKKQQTLNQKSNPKQTPFCSIFQLLFYHSKKKMKHKFVVLKSHFPLQSSKSKSAMQTRHPRICPLAHTTKKQKWKKLNTRLRRKRRRFRGEVALGFYLEERDCQKQNTNPHQNQSQTKHYRQQTAYQQYNSRR